MGWGMDATNPFVQSVIKSPFALNESNPFVRDEGVASQSVIDPANEEQFKDAQVRLQSIETGLNAIQRAKGVVMSAYAPGQFVSDIKNKIFVPIGMGTFSPNVKDEAVNVQLGKTFNDLSKAGAQSGGRLSNQQQEWEAQNQEFLKNPAGFWKNPELAAKTLNTLEAMYLNERHGLASAMGIEPRNMVMQPMPLGTKNDPIVIPTDPKERGVMLNWMAQTFGKITDPKATLTVKMPDGQVQTLMMSSFKHGGGQR
jgi:hypothetical protein